MKLSRVPDPINLLLSVMSHLGKSVTPLRPRKADWLARFYSSLPAILNLVTVNAPTGHHHEQWDFCSESLAKPSRAFLSH